MKVEGAERHPFLLVFRQLDRGSFLWNFLFFIHQSIFCNFALRKFFLQETFHIIKNIKGRIKEPTLS